MTDTAELNRSRAAVIAETVIRLGLTDVVLSPGARNTPLVLLLHDMREAGWNIRLHSILDERSAGFYALGIARRTDRPVLLSCTSGSAGAHYFPAIVEASEGHVPLLVITADRPEELQGRGSPQTMPQQNLYGPHVRWFADLGSPSNDRTEDETRLVVQQALQATLGEAPGPVHLNAPFRKPLWKAGGSVPTPLSTSTPYHRVQTQPSHADIDRLLAETAGRKGIIVVGPDPSARIELAAIRELSDCLGWPVLTDPASPLRYQASMAVVRHHDVLLRSDRFIEKMQPELAITVGGTTSSKPLANLLAKTSCVHISGSGKRQDPWQSVAWTLKADLQCLVERLGDRRQTPIASEWRNAWIDASRIVSNAIEKTCLDHIWEGSVANALVQSLPDNTLLRLASSMPIRDVDSFATKTDAHLLVSSNRGVNGIDGLIATSLGEAYGHKGPVAVLSGDLSFLHDIGSLATVPRPQTSVVFVVVDNGGGGIFGFLPMAAHPTGFEEWFVTPHNHDIPAICTGFGIEVDTAHSLEALHGHIAHRLKSPGLHVIHVPIDRTASTKRHEHSFRAITTILEKSL